VELTIHLHLVPRLRMPGAIPPLPQYIFMAWCLVKQRDNFIFSFLLTLLNRGLSIINIIVGISFNDKLSTE
jgi:hypothetical protein